MPINKSLSFVLLIFCCSCQELPKHNEPEQLSNEFHVELKPFYHGVASGDPLKDRVIIWTRVTPDKAAEVSVSWQISEEADFKSIANEGEVSTDSLRDYTVKVDAYGLKPGTKYYYQFEALGQKSIIGETATLPEQTDSLNLAVVSCSNYEFGYFTAYEKIAAQSDIFAVLHLGDYIYELGTGAYGDTASYKRYNYPPYEIVSLSDYRNRYSQYRLDEDLRLVHQKKPFIAVWDDHEIANNSYKTGAQNHQPDDGS